MSDWITFALPKGRIMQDSMALFAKIGITCPEMEEESRKLVFENRVDRYPLHGGARHRRADLCRIRLRRSRRRRQGYPARTGEGSLRAARSASSATAGWWSPSRKALREGDDPAGWSNIRVATKYPNVTERYFAAKGVQVELIKLYGSIELAPLVGLSERIVDLVSTGGTLRDNGLVEVETIAEITSRLIVNRASLKTKHQRIAPDHRRSWRRWSAEGVPRISELGTLSHASGRRVV